MDVRWVCGGRVEHAAVEDLERLLGRDDGWVWYDVRTGDPDAARILTDVFAFHPMAVRAAGRLRPASPVALSTAVVTALTNRMRDHIAMVTTQVWQLEQRVTAGHVGNPEDFLDELFRARHGLLAVRTMAALSREVYGRMVALAVFKAEGQPLLADTVDQFDRIRTMAEGQKDYLQGVIEFYQARTNTKISIAAERLAVIAAITLPVTALSSILGMNVIVNDSTRIGALVATLALMAVISTMLLVWTKRRGWW